MPGQDAAIPDYEPLASYETEIHSKGGAQPGVMKGTTAAARGTFGSGRVFCFSPHPEKTNSDQTRAMLKAALHQPVASGACASCHAPAAGKPFAVKAALKASS